MKPSSSETPSQGGYLMPAEWHPHASTWLTWPTNRITWPGERLERVRDAYLMMIQALLEHEGVDLLVHDEETAQSVRRRVEKVGANPEALRTHIIPTVDGWIRDYGPNFLIHPTDPVRPVAFNKWEFNAWGNKYPDLALDNAVVDELSRHLPGRMFRPKVVLEGGSIDVNGRGLCLTTRQCLLNPNRNPDLSRECIEDLLKSYLNVERVIWLDEGVVGDDTDGHIDDIARFAAPDIVVCAVEEDPTDANFPMLKANHETLCHLSTREDLFGIVSLPMPEPVVDGGERLPASYANFYIANGLVLVPVFGQERDRSALDILQGVFPGRRVLGIPATDMVYGLGAVHCLTQQQPQASSLVPCPE